MVRTKEDLKEYIKADKKAMSYRGGVKEYLKGNVDDVKTMNFIVSLRKYEYVVNNYKRYGLFGKIWYLYHKHLFARKRRKTNFYISTNVFGKGLKIVHPGYLWVDSSSRIGENCTILPRVLLGKKHPGIKPPCIFIGDNCYIGTGTTILGPVRIGNNVTIGAGAVVLDDIPDNCIVAGVPAKVIKTKDTNS